MRHNACTFFALFLAAGIFLPAAKAQATGDDYLKNAVTGAFRYQLRQGYDGIDNAPGYGVAYSYRPLRWLAVEAGLDQIVRPFGSSACCEYVDNERDELYLIPFGARYVASLQAGRVLLSAGGGGAYMKYAVPGYYSYLGFSTWGGQAVVSISYGVTQSGRFRFGATGRYYYTRLYTHATRFLTLGPEFTFAF